MGERVLAMGLARATARVISRSAKRACGGGTDPGAGNRSGRRLRAADRHAFGRLEMRPAALAALGALLAFVGAPARAETLVSNLDLTESVDLSLSDKVRIQEFTTGEESVVLDRVEIKFSSGSADIDPPTATLRRWDGSTYVLVADLAGPDSLAAGDNEFAAPEDTTLRADTQYAVRLEGGGSGLALRGTTDDREGGRSGWSIRDESSQKDRGASGYETRVTTLMIRVNGAVETDDEDEVGGASNPFATPEIPIVSVSETSSEDGNWTVSWSQANPVDVVIHIELEETWPVNDDGASSVSTYELSQIPVPMLAKDISGRTIEGVYSYRARACNIDCSVWSQPVTVTFGMPNDQPVVSAISDQSVSAGGTQTVTVTVADDDSDDSHTVSASSDDTGVVKVSVSRKTLTVRGVSRGEATITVTATDDSGATNATSAAVEFDVTVPNSRPVVGSISNMTVERTKTGTRTASATDADTGDAHTVEATSSNTGVATVSVSGKTITVTGVSRGTATITVTATDNSGESNAKSAAVTFTATVPNSRPVLGSISDLTVTRGSMGTRTVSVTDGDIGDTHTVEADSDDRFVATVNVSGKTLTVTGVAAGAATIEVTARDNSEESNDTSVPKEFEVEVEIVNSRPVVRSISNVTVSRGYTRSVQVSVTDADSGDRHTVSASSNATSVATVSRTGNPLRVTGVSRGRATITVTATDNSGADNDTSAPETFRATVPNSRPVVPSIPNLAVARGSTGTRAVSVTDGDRRDTHTVRATTNNRSVATVSVNGKTLTVRGVSCGVAIMSVTATDNSGESNATSRAQTFRATVPNTRPSVGTISDLAVSRGSTGTRTVSVTDSDSGDTPDIEAASDDTSVAMVVVTGNTLTVTGVARGTATITVTATDDCGATGSRDFDVTVPNTRPVVASISDLAFWRGSEGTRIVSVTDGDIGDTHRVSASSSSSAVATVKVSEDETELELKGVSIGETTITVTATDNSGESSATSAAVEF